MLKCIVPAPLFCCNLQTGYNIRSYTAATLHMYVHWKFILLVKSTCIFHVKLKTQVWIFTESFSCLALTTVSDYSYTPVKQTFSCWGSGKNNNSLNQDVCPGRAVGTGVQWAPCFAYNKIITYWTRASVERPTTHSIPSSSGLSGSTLSGTSPNDLLPPTL